MNGNLLPQARPSGADDDGPVVPWQPPSTFGATTNQRSVSSGHPGPMSPCHQPRSGVAGAGLADDVAVAGERVQHEDGVVARG